MFWSSLLCTIQYVDMTEFKKIYFTILFVCWCRLLITYANSFNPNQAQLLGLIGSKLFDTLIVLLNVFFEKVNFEKKSAKKKSQNARS